MPTVVVFCDERSVTLLGDSSRATNRGEILLQEPNRSWFPVLTIIPGLQKPISARRGSRDVEQPETSGGCVLRAYSPCAKCSCWNQETGGVEG